jgi:hypothetical protein
MRLGGVWQIDNIADRSKCCQESCIRDWSKIKKALFFDFSTVDIFA